MKSRLGILAAVFLMFVRIVDAQIQEIRATGEYRMGDNDTRADARRLAVLDAKRQALDRAGTYLASLTEVRNLQLSKDEVDAYSAGILQVLEQSVTVMDDVARADVLVRVDTADVIRRIDSLRKDKATSTELLEMQKQMQQMRETLEAQNKLLATLTSKPDVDRTSQQRQQTMAKVDAKQLLSQAWAVLAGSSEATLMVGSSSAEGRQRARQLIEQALAAEPGNAEGHFKMGDVLLEEGRGAAAEREYQDGLKFGGDPATGHLKLGLALSNQGNFNSAIVEYREAIRINPNNADAHDNLGNALSGQGNFNGAIAEYREAIRINPNYADAHDTLGIVLNDQGNLNGAIAEYREAVRINPNDFHAHYNLGLALRAQGDRGGAAREFREYLRSVPNIPSQADFMKKAQDFINE